MTNVLDTIGVTEEFRGAIEAVDEKFVQEKLLIYQNKTWDVFNEIRKNLSEGLTEDEARKLSLSIFEKFGVTKHWHKPYLRFGAGTALTFHDPLQTDYRLKKGDSVYIDIGPVWTDTETGLSFEGDVGDTFAFGENLEVEKCAATARQLFEEAKVEWKKKTLTGEQIYGFLNRRASELGYVLIQNVDGHRTGDFPHHKYSKERLAGLKFSPERTRWVLEVQINDPQSRFGAFFEDIL